MSEPKDDSTIDIREHLTDFWLAVMGDAGVDISDRVKVLECLAKYILGDGKPKVKRKGPVKPSTSEIMRLAAGLEKNGHN